MLQSETPEAPITEPQEEHDDRPSARRLIALAVTLAIVWVLMSGHFDVITLTWAAVAVVTAVYVARRMNVVDHEGFPLHLSFRLFGYLSWLGKEIVKSNLDVTRIILNPSLPISPQVRTFRVLPRTDLGKVIYANSITLTPGTITIGIVGDEFEVHALTRAAWDGTEEGEMGRRVRQLEG